MLSDKLLDRYSIISDQVDRHELRVILQELELQLQRDETVNVVEFGCYIGTTSLFIARLLRKYHRETMFHVYDSFVGLPDKTAQDISPAGEQFKTGELAVSKTEFIKQFKKAGLPLPRIHKRWFSELTANDIPDDISFAFLDGDYYESIRDSLALITPKLTKRAIVIVDDYANEALPGAAVATNEWRHSHHSSYRVEHSLAIIHQ